MSRPLQVVPPHRRRIPELRKGVYILPNLVTSAGLFAGFYSIIATLNRDFRMAASMIFVAGLCDLLDGRVARLTHTSSSFGVQYDSLADVIAFGVAPGVLMHTWALRPWGQWGWLAAGLYVICGALRLARFNVQVATVEKRYFVGLPIPAAAAVVASTVLLYYHLGGQGELAKQLVALLVVFGVAGLMVSEIRYFSFKEFHMHQRHPFSLLLGLIFLTALLIGAPQVMLFAGSLGYALSGPARGTVRVLRRQPPPGTVSDPSAASARSA